MPSDSPIITETYADTDEVVLGYVETDVGQLQGFLNADERGVAAATNGKVSFTIDRAALQMTGYTENPTTHVLTPQPGWGVVGQPFTVTYAFRSTEPTRYPEDAGGFSRFNAAQIAQAEKALQAWADVANIRFSRVGFGDSGEQAYSNSATILLANYSTGVSGASAFGMFPGNVSFSSSSGDVWINVTLGTNASPALGNYGAQVLVHELGHAIGLNHPGDYNAGTDPNATITYASNAEYYEDSRQYSVMSYFSETNTGASFGGRYASVPLLDDIAAAQVEYGPNMSTRTGDTVYGFNSTADREWFLASSSSTKLVFAIWDAGGNDTLDFSGYFQNATIDLRAGYFSSVGGLVGNVAIAQGVTIENAKGGSGSDLITGNGAANSIFGGAAQDTILGGAGQDYLRGEDGADVIYGGDDFDDVHGNAGADTVYGGRGDDWVVGGKDNDSLYGDEGADVVLGNLGNDTLEGGAGNDIVRGGQGDDVVSGGDGDDWISGDLGADLLSGGPGADIFHIFTGAGADRVIDFAAGVDRVQLLPGQIWTAAQVGADTVVYMDRAGSADQLILVNVQLSVLPQGWIF